ncbi:MAG: hypothetical protein CSA26_02810 [Desulfobacterales bacterium]|nr:MAG: hypothetical protein CSA26_02810 [Desulfobacterales bacterium]
MPYCFFRQQPAAASYPVANCQSNKCGEVLFQDACKKIQMISAPDKSYWQKQGKDAMLLFCLIKNMRRK